MAVIEHRALYSECVTLIDTPDDHAIAGVVLTPDHKIIAKIVRCPELEAGHDIVANEKVVRSPEGKVIDSIVLYSDAGMPRPQPKQFPAGSTQTPNFLIKEEYPLPKGAKEFLAENGEALSRELYNAVAGKAKLKEKSRHADKVEPKEKTGRAGVGSFRAFLASLIHRKEAAVPKIGLPDLSGIPGLHCMSITAGEGTQALVLWGKCDKEKSSGVILDAHLKHVIGVILPQVITPSASYFQTQYNASQQLAQLPGNDPESLAAFLDKRWREVPGTVVEGLNLIEITGGRGASRWTRRSSGDSAQSL